MGNDRTTSIQNQKVELTPEESKLNKLELERAQAAQGGMIETQLAGTNLVNNLLTGKQLPGYLKPLSEGISSEVTQDIVNQSLADLAPTFGQQGILDSGVAASISGRTAGDIRRNSAEFNLNNLSRLLELAVGGATSIQQPLLSQNQALGARLSTARTGITNLEQNQMNPFLRSFLSSVGSTMGQELGSPSSTFQRTMSGASMGAGMSSKKYKENIKPAEIDSISVLKETDIYEFNYKPEFGDTKERIGIIAEEAPEILTAENRDKFDMYNAIGILIDANKKLIDRIERLENKGTEHGE